MSKEISSTATQRNYGIDTLRIFSMLGIVIMHILYKGTLLTATTGFKNMFLWFVEAIFYSSVNCFAMISGYVSCLKREQSFGDRCNKYINMWLGVLFWSVIINLAVMTFGNTKVGMKDMIKSFLPVITKKWWYFSAYTPLFFLIPYINRFIAVLSKREITKLVILLFIIFSVTGLISDPFCINYGYSFLWLAIMYILGAWIKICEIPQKISVRTAAAVAAVCVLISFAMVKFSPFMPEVMMKYISPTMVLYAVCLMILFSRMKINKRGQGLIALLSPLTFGVYIIHVHPMVECNFEKWFSWMGELNTFIVTVYVFLFAIVIFTACAFLEKMRMVLFAKLNVSQKICNMLIKLGRKMSKKA